MTFFEKSDTLPYLLLIPMLGAATGAAYQPYKHTPRIYSAVSTAEKVGVVTLTVLESLTLLWAVSVLNRVIIDLALSEDEKNRRQVSYNAIWICSATATLFTSMLMVAESRLVDKFIYVMHKCLNSRS